MSKIRFYDQLRRQWIITRKLLYLKYGVKVMPSRALALLLAIGFIDLFATAILHSAGLIVELNPLMRPLIESHELLFAAVKGTTLISAWAVMAWYAQHNLSFVRQACLIGSAAYVGIWCSWFFSTL